VRQTGERKFVQFIVQKTVNNGMRMAESINIQHIVEIPGVVIA